MVLLVMSQKVEGQTVEELRSLKPGITVVGTKLFLGSWASPIYVQINKAGQGRQPTYVGVFSDFSAIAGSMTVYLIKGAVQLPNGSYPLFIIDIAYIMPEFRFTQIEYKYWWSDNEVTITRYAIFYPMEQALVQANKSVITTVPTQLSNFV